jgi:hypothetical protein
MPRSEINTKSRRCGQEEGSDIGDATVAYPRWTGLSPKEASDRDHRRGFRSRRHPTQSSGQDSGTKQATSAIVATLTSCINSSRVVSTHRLPQQPQSYVERHRLRPGTWNRAPPFDERPTAAGQGRCTPCRQPDDHEHTTPTTSPRAHDPYNISPRHQEHTTPTTSPDVQAAVE